MTFLYPNVLYALILPALLAAAAWWLWRRRSRKWEVLISPEYRQELVHAPATWHRVLPVIFAVLASIFAILSIARPVDGYTEVKEIPKSRNILIAIDCSRSMLSKDASPTRLGRAKTAAYDLLDALPGDNFGIIIFSGDAVLLMPLTHDHNALKETIEQLQFGWVSQGGTNLENVVRLALQTFKRDKEADAKNALVILSDGEDTVNITYKTAEAARQHQLIIVTAGIGTTIGTTIPDEQSPSGLYRDRRGQHVVSKLNPESLQYLARQTDGQYVQLSDGAALNRFVQGHRGPPGHHGRPGGSAPRAERPLRHLCRSGPHLPAPHSSGRYPLALLPPFRTPRHDRPGRRNPALRRTAGHGSARGHERPGQRHGPDPDGKDRGSRQGH